MDIQKESGEREHFSQQKFCASLLQSGAPPELSQKVCDAVTAELKPGMTTSDIFRRASKHLAKANVNVATRYNLKRGMASLGPAGFIFEQFVEEILRTLGFSTQRNLMMRGVCVTHEIDILAKKDNDHFLVEAKYHNRAGIKTHVDVAMYADARLRDIEEVQKQKEHHKATHNMWLITNTKFSENAIKYGTCRKMKLTGWNYPKYSDTSGNAKNAHAENNFGLEKIIEKHALYPVTSLPGVNTQILERFAEHNMMFARDIAPYSGNDLEKQFGIARNSARIIATASHKLVLGKG